MKQDELYNRIDVRFFRFIEKICIKYKYKCYYLQSKKDKKKWETLFNNSTFFKYMIDDHTVINLYKDSVLSKIIYDGFEQDEILFIRRFLKKGDVFLDVGANIGLFSLIASYYVENEGIIYAFEPTPEIFRRLCENVEINTFNNVLTFQIGLSNKEEELVFNISPTGYDAWNSFSKLKYLKDSHSILLKTTTLDFFLNQQKISEVNFIKIDVEGWEMNVLKGSKELLSKEKAPVLMVEFTEENAFSAGFYCGEIYDYVKQFGYNWYRYDSKQNALICEEKKLHYPYDNLFAIKDIDAVIKRIQNNETFDHHGQS